MLTLLFKYREKFPFGTWAWSKAWLRRLKTAFALASYVWERTRLRSCGCRLADAVVVSRLTVHGNASNIEIGPFVCIGIAYMQAHASISVGKSVIINDGVKIITGSHDVHSSTYDHVFKPVAIGDYAWIATDAMILPGVTIGRGAIIAARSVVTRDVAAYSIVAGNPARNVGTRRCEDFRYLPFSWFGPTQAWIGVNPTLPA